MDYSVYHLFSSFVHLFFILLVCSFTSFFVMALQRFLIVCEPRPSNSALELSYWLLSIKTNFQKIVKYLKTYTKWPNIIFTETIYNKHIERDCFIVWVPNREQLLLTGHPWGTGERPLNIGWPHNRGIYLKYSWFRTLVKGWPLTKWSINRGLYLK